MAKYALLLSSVTTVIAFTADLLMPLGYAGGVLYVCALLVAGWYLSRKEIIAISVLLALLVVVGFFLSKPGIDGQAALLNRGLDLLAIAGVAWVMIARSQAGQDLEQAKLIFEGQVKARTKEFQELVSEHRGTVVELDRSRAQAQAILETAVDGVITIDAECRIVSFNKAAERMFGFSAEEVIGHNVKMLMPEPYRAHHDSYVGNYQETGFAKIIGIGREVVGLRKDGSTFPMYLAVSQIKLEDGVMFAGITRDISDIKRAEYDLRQSQAETKAILETAVDGIITIDERCLVCSFNKGAERMFGYDADEVIGRNVKMLMPEPYRANHDSYVRNYRETGFAKIIGIGREVVGRRKDGSTFPMYLAVSQVETDSGVKFAGITRDISDVKRAEEELKVAIREANEANKAKSEFLSQMSHELRSPLNSIIGFSEVLKSEFYGPLADERYRRYARNIHTAGNHLLNVIGEILDISKIEAGGLDLEKIDCGIGKILESVRSAVAIRAEERNLEFSIDVDKNVPLWVRCDPTRIRQILVNFADNAVKFTEKGGVYISLECGDVIAAGTGSVADVIFKVKDTGIGIAEDKIDDLCTPFMQADTSITRRYGGTGLGLAICRQLVELMGGEMGIESEVGKGSCFWFRLPMEIIDTPDDERAGESGFDVPPLSILLVEDIEMNATVAKALLEPDGHRIEVAENGKVALEAVGKKHYDVILMDVHMPVMDGLEATRLIRQLSDPIKAEVPIFAMTADVLKEKTEEYMEAGMTGCIGKPFQLADVRRELANIAPTTGGVREEPMQQDRPGPHLLGVEKIETVSAPSQAAKREGRISALDHERLNALASSLPPVAFEQIMTRIVTDSSKIVEEVRSAFLAGDKDALRKKAHAMKGFSSNFGLDSLCKTSKKIQDAVDQASSEELSSLIVQIDQELQKSHEELRSFRRIH